MTPVKEKMKEVTLQVDKKKFKTFLDFVKTLEYVEVVDEEQSALEEFEISLQQVKLMQEGKIPKQSAKDFLHEI
jgi:cystathionine beta-lyase family protein involved in aluminum resistance